MASIDVPTAGSGENRLHSGIIAYQLRNSNFAQPGVEGIILYIIGPTRSIGVDTQQIVILALGLVLLIALMFWPQWQARRRQQKQMAELQVGQEVMTVGGLIGRLTRLDPEANEAAMEIAPGIEIRIVPAAISRPLVASSPAEEQPEENPERPSE
jgi:preprotein translocase subunit YajC